MTGKFVATAGFVLGVLCLLTSYMGKPAGPFVREVHTVTGKITGLKAGQIIYLQSAERITLSSVKAYTNGFTIKRELAETNVYHVLIGKENIEFQFVWDADITIEGSLKEPQKIAMKGSPLTDELVLYEKTYNVPVRNELIRITQEVNRLRARGDTNEAYKALRKKSNETFAIAYEDAKNYIEANPESFISLRMLKWGWSRIGSKELLNSLSASLQQHSIAAALRAESTNNETADLGSLMPDFSLPDLTGKSFGSVDLSGQYTLIDFWGTWCSPCLALMPELSRVHQEYRSDSVQFVGFVCEKQSINPGSLQQFLRKRNVNWRQIPVDMTDTTAVDTKWEVISFPTFILVGPNRRVLARGIGSRGLNECINVLAARKKP